MSTNTRVGDLALILVLFSSNWVLDLIQGKGKSDSVDWSLQVGADSAPAWELAPDSRRRSSQAVATITIDYHPPRVPIDAFVLRLHGAAPNALEVMFNDRVLGSTVLGPQSSSFLLDRDDFRLDALSLLQLQWLGNSEDRLLSQPRIETITINEASTPTAGIEFSDDLYFAEGFDPPHGDLRWTRNGSATLQIPWNRPLRHIDYELAVLATTSPRTLVRWHLNGQSLGSMRFEDRSRSEESVRFSGFALRSGINQLELELSAEGGESTGQEQLGLRWLAILPQTAGR